MPSVENLSQAKATCAELKVHRNLVQGNAVFPGDPITTSVSFGIPKTDIVREQGKNTDEMYRGWVHSFGKEEADKVLPWLNRTVNYTAFALIGCVGYLFAPSPDVHGTSFSFSLSRSSPETLNGITTSVIDISKDRVFGSDELKLTPNIMGRDAD
jgi:hypothetical protein